MYWGMGMIHVLRHVWFEIKCLLHCLSELQQILWIVIVLSRTIRTQLLICLLSMVLAYGKVKLKVPGLVFSARTGLAVTLTYLLWLRTSRLQYLNASKLCFLSLNVNGNRDMNKRISLMQCLSHMALDFVLLQETQVASCRECEMWF